MEKVNFLKGLAIVGFGLVANAASAASIQVSITNNADANGTYLTPAWFGFHDGSFDTFNAGGTAGAGLEALAEDGNTSVLNGEFTAAQANGVSGQANGGPLAPSATSTTVFNNVNAANNSYFSYAAMVLPSNDYFIGNDNALNISNLINGTTDNLVISVLSVYDAGTEVNDFATSAANGLFGIAGGQTGPNQGADQNGIITPADGLDFLMFASIGNVPNADLSALNFSNYDTIATIELTNLDAVSAVPVPAALPLMASALGMFGVARRKKVTA